jgi:hypothetical protein
MGYSTFIGFGSKLFKKDGIRRFTNNKRSESPETVARECYGIGRGDL